MNSKNIFRILFILIFCGINAAAYFLLFAATIEQYQKNQEAYNERQLKKEDLQQKQGTLDTLKQQAAAYKQNTQLYANLSIPFKETAPDGSLEKSHIEAYLASLGRHIQCSPISASVNKSTEPGSLVYQCEIQNLVVDFKQLNALIYSLMQSTEQEFLDKIQLKPEYESLRPSILRPRLFVIKELSIAPKDAQSDDAELPPNPLEISIFFDYVYFIGPEEK